MAEEKYNNYPKADTTTNNKNKGGDMYIMTPVKKYKKTNRKQIKVVDYSDKQKQNAKTLLRQTIKEHKFQIKQLKQDIKKHKLLIKQAKIYYKLKK